MFIALLVQKSEGCDYTIGCGMKWENLGAINLDDALEELKKCVIGTQCDDCENGYEEGYWDDESLSDVVLLDVSEKHIVPVRSWYKSAITDAKLRKKRKIESYERAEYDRLKAKFE
jgi:hypothetical protein